MQADRILTQLLKISKNNNPTPNNPSIMFIQLGTL